MLRYRGGSHVESGFYWNVARWTIETVGKEGGLLPGVAEHRYVKVPVLLLFALAPVMGGLYVVFLPCIGFAMVLALATRKALEAATRLAHALMATVSPAWQPGEAYFAEKGSPRETEAKREERESTDLTAR